MAHTYKLASSPVVDLAATIDELQTVMAHIANFENVSLIGSSITGVAIVVTDNPIPPTEVAHLNLTEI